MKRNKRKSQLRRRKNSGRAYRAGSVRSVRRVVPSTQSNFCERLQVLPEVLRLHGEKKTDKGD
jgi:hypothetical protein